MPRRDLRSVAKAEAEAGKKSYEYMYMYIYIGIILSFMRFYCLVAIISALKRCQPETAHKVEQLIKFYGNCNSSEAADK